MTAAARPSASSALFAVAIGLGAFLLFLVQFILGKQLLPWFGGAPAVWTTCMLFFQLLLLGGYGYAHLLADRFTPARQRDIHLAALALAAVLLLVRAFVWPAPISPSDAWKPDPEASPILAILGLLTFTVGLPFLVLAATGPLLQSWFARVRPGVSPYRLYALSNLGSLLGMFSYPFALEPALPIAGQGWVWSVGFLAFAVACAACAVLAGGAPALTKPSGHIASDSKPGAGRRLLWFGLAAVPSTMLLATTSQISQEVAVIPFLWMLPLALYLLSFILCFEYERSYVRALWLPLLVLGAGGATYALFAGVYVGMVLQLVIYLVTLMAYCMVGHGELVRQKPDPKYLTQFYLIVSAGGAAGGIFTGVVAPLAFPEFWELPIALFVGFALAMYVLYRGAWPQRLWLSALSAFGVLVGSVALAGALGYHMSEQLDDNLFVTRNFFGVLRVDRASGGTLTYTRLRHGRITHGIQFEDEPLNAAPTSYYGPTSGVGLAVDKHPRRLAGERLHIGVVGLGAGTMASYGRAGDRVRFYEINPAVVALSSGDEPFFTYLQSSPAEVAVVIGDARVALEREQPQAFDVLAIDAFSSDSIPAHLLTVEAVELYFRHLREGGILAVHISNRYLDLDPVVRGIGEKLGLHVEYVEDLENDEVVWQSDWMLLARRESDMDSPDLINALAPKLDPEAPYPLWTDAYSNLLQVLKR
ncbi:fused MFS/spermidine synthase [Nannocystis radixulma]|uniref:Fused MFS/spermidine synthase n=1 Tax=Nannocystis radixulma TaxID=2995305 RepID=A0ABT5BNL8_9BACT|nr:fused MFS/spermidine synthase [Nannocystis radixulma]MDC0674978.1 fused MFS/spermidine synthase [Nannocystis radixulma]